MSACDECTNEATHHGTDEKNGPWKLCADCHRAALTAFDGDGLNGFGQPAIGAIVPADKLNDAMPFDHVVTINADGTVSDGPDGIYAPELIDLDTGGDTRWTPVGPYSGQEGGGWHMHDCESIGGRMARDILAEPGTYVAVAAVWSPDDDSDSDEPTTEGWAVFRMVEPTSPAPMPDADPVDFAEVAAELVGTGSAMLPRDWQATLTTQPDDDYSLIDDAEQCGPDGWCGRVEWSGVGGKRPDGFDGGARIIARSMFDRLWCQPPTTMAEADLDEWFANVAGVYENGAEEMALKIEDADGNLIGEANLCGVIGADDDYRRHLAAELLREAWPAEAPPSAWLPSPNDPSVVAAVADIIGSMFHGELPTTVRTWDDITAAGMDPSDYYPDDTGDDDDTSWRVAQVVADVLNSFSPIEMLTRLLEVADESPADTTGADWVDFGAKVLGVTVLGSDREVMGWVVSVAYENGVTVPTVAVMILDMIGAPGQPSGPRRPLLCVLEDEQGDPRWLVGPFTTAEERSAFAASLPDSDLYYGPTDLVIESPAAVLAEINAMEAATHDE